MRDAQKLWREEFSDTKILIPKHNLQFAHPTFPTTFNGGINS